jgi:hypothetical protein
LKKCRGRSSGYRRRVGGVIEHYRRSEGGGGVNIEVVRKEEEKEII